MWRIARQLLAEHIPKRYAVNENSCPLLDNGYIYRSIICVSGTMQTWTAVIELLEVVVSIGFSGII
jgi:hypothetical protein